MRCFHPRQAETPEGHGSDGQARPNRPLGALAALTIEQEAQSVCFHWTWRQTSCQQEINTWLHHNTHTMSVGNGNTPTANQFPTWTLTLADLCWSSESWRQRYNNKEKRMIDRDEQKNTVLRLRLISCQLCFCSLLYPNALHPNSSSTEWRRGSSSEHSNDVL